MSFKAIVFVNRDLKGELKAKYKLLSHERLFKMLKNDMCITAIGQVINEQGNPQTQSENVVFRPSELPSPDNAKKTLLLITYSRGNAVCSYLP